MSSSWLRRWAVWVSVLVVVAQSARAQAAPLAGDSAWAATAKPHRDPRLARRLGFVPGLGHMYAGEYLHGYSMWVGTVGGIGMGPVVFQLDDCSFRFFEQCEPKHTMVYRAMGVLLTAGGVALWIKSVRDAPRAARRANERRLRVAPVVTPPGPDGGWRFGVELRPHD